MALMTRIRLLQTGLAAVGAVVLDACGEAAPTTPASTVAPTKPAATSPSPAPTVQAAAAPTAAPTSLPSGPFPFKVTSATYFAAGERLEWTNKTADEFARINGPKITVENLQVTGNFTEALIASIASGSGPDVARSSGSWMSDFADKGSLVDIGPYARRDKVDLSQWYAQEEVLIRKGKHYGMPFWQAHSIFLYNKTMLTNNGVKPPEGDTWTWTDMLEAAQKLTKTGETFGIQMNYIFEFAWLNFIRSAGEDYINGDRTKTTINSAGNIEVFQWLVDLVQKYKVLGNTGLIGSTQFGKPDFEWDMFVTPKHPKTGKRACVANENPTVVISQTKNPEASYMLAKFYADKFSQDLVGKLRINSPSLRSSATDQAVWLAPPPANMKIAAEQMKHAGSLSFHLNWLQWYNETTKQLLPAFKGEMSVREACDKASQIGDSLLRGA